MWAREWSKIYRLKLANKFNRAGKAPFSAKSCDTCRRQTLTMVTKLVHFTVDGRDEQAEFTSDDNPDILRGKWNRWNCVAFISRPDKRHAAKVNFRMTHNATTANSWKFNSCRYQCTLNIVLCHIAFCIPSNFIPTASINAIYAYFKYTNTWFWIKFMKLSMLKYQLSASPKWDLPKDI